MLLVLVWEYDDVKRDDDSPLGDEDNDDEEGKTANLAFGFTNEC